MNYQTPYDIFNASKFQTIIACFFGTINVKQIWTVASSGTQEARLFYLELTPSAVRFICHHVIHLAAKSW